MKYREEYLILIADNDRNLSLKMSRSLMDAGYKTVIIDTENRPYGNWKKVNPYCMEAIPP